MGSGTELAKAYVQIIPSADGIKKQLTDILGSETDGLGDKVGNKLGQSLGATLVKAVGAIGLGQTLKDTLLKGADLQQSIGGVETLFKENADTVIANAKKAYETAGMSANNYMETVTSFSASLLQGLGGNTELAATMADRALVDMSDNANKMGTDMASIQNAYQGFAKQNYTMLDNLKLGYGGTKEEMKRLIVDAAAMTDVQKELGVTVDASSMSFDNIINAISVMQENMGIAGATADEAKGTFTGSFNAMKAAAENFMATLTTGENVGESLTALFDTAFTFVKGNLIPMVGNVFSSLGRLLWEQGAQMINSGSNMLTSFINGISDKLPDLIPKAFEMIVTLSDALLKNFPKIVQAGIGLITSLIQGIVNSLPTLIVEGPRIINEFSSAIYTALGQLAATGLKMIVSLVKGLWDNRKLILENAGAIFQAFMNVFSLANLFGLGKNLVVNLKKGIEAMAKSPMTALKDIATKAIEAVKNLNWKELGKNIISGIVNGIKNNIATIISALTSAAGDALEAVKQFLGIKSPSRVFRDEVGKMIDMGLVVGIEDNLDVVRRAMNDLSVATVGSVQTDFSVGNSMQNFDFSNNDNAKLEQIYASLALLEDNKMDANTIGKAIANAIETAGLSIKIGRREFGRIVREVG